MQVVLVGDSEGEINTYLLKNTQGPPTDQVLSVLTCMCGSYYIMSA